MKKIYSLKTCSTCQRIIKALNLSQEFLHQDNPYFGIRFRGAQSLVWKL